MDECINETSMSGYADSNLSANYVFNFAPTCVGHVSVFGRTWLVPVDCGSPRNSKRSNPLNIKPKSNDVFGLRSILRAALLAAPVVLAANAYAISDCGSCVYPPPSGGHPNSGTMACSACHTVTTPPPVVEPPVTPPPVVEPPVVEPPVVEPPVVEPPVVTPPPVTPPSCNNCDDDNDHDRDHDRDRDHDKKDKKDKKDSKNDKKKSKSKDRHDD